MERDSQDSQGYKLESQIREAYGRVVYSQTCHEKCCNHLVEREKKIKVSQIVLSAMTTSSGIFTIITDKKISGIIGAALSLCLLILNSYVKNYNLAKDAQEHRYIANLLWKIREEYVSLLVDFEVLDINQIMAKRDELQNRTAEVYKNAPRTDSKSYIETQRALKEEEEQTFCENEIDMMLPNSIRRCNRNVQNDNKCI